MKNIDSWSNDINSAVDINSTVDIISAVDINSAVDFAVDSAPACTYIQIAQKWNLWHKRALNKTKKAIEMDLILLH